jgi:hypothetical protein
MRRRGRVQMHEAAIASEARSYTISRVSPQYLGREEKGYQ